MLENLVLEERNVTLAAGDMLVAYSDGIPDAINLAVDDYGLDRLIALIDRNRQQPVGVVCQAIFDDVFAFRGAAAAFDDITALRRGAHRRRRGEGGARGPAAARRPHPRPGPRSPREPSGCHFLRLALAASPARSWWPRWRWWPWAMLTRTAELPSPTATVVIITAPAAAQTPSGATATIQSPPTAPPAPATGNGAARPPRRGVRWGLCSGGRHR
jgi:hypothetical protein